MQLAEESGLPVADMLSFSPNRRFLAGSASKLVLGGRLAFGHFSAFLLPAQPDYSRQTPFSPSEPFAPGRMGRCAGRFSFRHEAYVEGRARRSTGRMSIARSRTGKVLKSSARAHHWFQQLPQPNFTINCERRRPRPRFWLRVGCRPRFGLSRDRQPASLARESPHEQDVEPPDPPQAGRC